MGAFSLIVVINLLNRHVISNMKKKSDGKKDSELFSSIFKEDKTKSAKAQNTRRENPMLSKVHSSNHKLSKKIEKKAKKLKKKTEKQKIIEASDVSSISDSEVFNSASDFFSDCEAQDPEKHRLNFEKLQKIKRFVKNCSSSENETFDGSENGRYCKTTYTRVSRTS